MKGVGGASRAEEGDSSGDARRPTGSGQQVLQGYKWQVQGSNGLNAAQLSHPWGSTLIFQRNAGVSWVFGLRHGVAMHRNVNRILLYIHGRATHRNVNSSHNTNQLFDDDHYYDQEKEVKPCHRRSLASRGDAAKEREEESGPYH